MCGRALTAPSDHGLRVWPALAGAQYLEVSDIDGPHDDPRPSRQGGQGPLRPLPRATLTIFRAHWRRHRNPRLLFPACGRDGIHRPAATHPFPRTSLQIVFRQALLASGIPSPLPSTRCAIPTPPICWKAALMRTVKEYLGHRSANTTVLYTHLTDKVQQHSRQALDHLLEGL